MCIAIIHLMVRSPDVQVWPDGHIEVTSSEEEEK